MLAMSSDGNAAAEHVSAPAFREAGFVSAGGGLLLSLRELRVSGEPEREPEFDPDLDEADLGG
jgi:hypothetical protein